MCHEEKYGWKKKERAVWGKESGEKRSVILLSKRVRSGEHSVKCFTDKESE